MATDSDRTDAAARVVGPELASDRVDAARASRFFISYRHGEQDEEQLARHLQEGLTQDGRDVFIDETMTIGTDWVEEIGARIRWCDYLIVLLSELSMTSEMVQAEIRLAARRRREEGKPHILPIRVRYTGLLEYELESYLGRIEYALWTSAADTARVLREILEVTRGKAFPNQAASVSAPARQLDPRRPLPHVDPRTLTAPGGTIAADDSLYVHRQTDDVASVLAGQTGNTLVIKAPRQMGKSSLLIRHLAASAQQHKRLAFVDISVLSQDELASYPTFLCNLAVALLRSLGYDISPATKIQTQQQLTWLMEDTLLPAAGGPVVIAFDELDRVLGRQFQSDFFSMLRMWHNNRTHPVHRASWKNLDLALVISTEPYLLIAEGDRSPFNVGTTVELLPFGRPEVHALSEAYRSSLTDAQVEDLGELLGGHPYLLRLAFYWLVGPRQMPFEELLRHAAEERGPFGEHLRALLFRLHTRPELLAGLRQIIFRGASPTDDVYYRLYGAGLVRRDGNRIVPANLLYARFFKKVL